MSAVCHRSARLSIVCALWLKLAKVTNSTKNMFVFLFIVFLCENSEIIQVILLSPDFSCLSYYF